MAANDSVVLRTAGLCKSFGGIRALDSLNLEVYDAAINGLAGPNGAGKSTAFAIVTGHQRADAGNVFLAGQRVTGFAPARLATQPPGITRSFQEVRVFEQMSVLDNVLIARPFRADRTLLGVVRRLAISRELRTERARAMQILELLQLSDVATRAAHRLSHGQRKLVELGRCLVSDARVILLDEPFAGVNPALIVLICLALQDARTRLRKSFLVVDHNMSAMRDLCDTLSFMEAGRIVGVERRPALERPDDR